MTEEEKRQYHVEAVRLWRKKHPEKVAEYMRKYRAKHPNKVAEINEETKKKRHSSKPKFDRSAYMKEYWRKKRMTKVVTLTPMYKPVTVGDVVDFLRNNEALRQMRDRTITLKTTVGEVLDLFGEENVKTFIQEKTAAAAHKDEYENSWENIVANWLMLLLFVAVFAILATVVLELIDKDKR